MIKKLLFSVLSFTALSISLPMDARDILLEVKGAGFFPTSNIYRKIYHNSGIFGAELTFNMHCNLYGWFSVDGLRKTGYSINGDVKTKVSYLPIGFGLKYFQPFCYGDLYIGLGALAARVHTHDYSPYVVPLYTKWGGGAVAKVGAIFDVSCSFFIDAFFNYSFVRASSYNTNGGLVYPHKAKVDGCSLGLGLGYRFN